MENIKTIKLCLRSGQLRGMGNWFFFQEQNEAGSRLGSAWAGVLSLPLLVLISSALIPSCSPTVFIVTFSFSRLLAHGALEPFDMWEHFLGPGTSHPWLPHWRRGGREEREAGPGWYEEPAERDLCACDSLPLSQAAEDLHFLSGSPTLLRSRCADGRRERKEEWEVAKKWKGKKNPSTEHPREKRGASHSFFLNRH